LYSVTLTRLLLSGRGTTRSAASSDFAIIVHTLSWTLFSYLCSVQ